MTEAGVVASYPDEQIRQELIGFFGWRPKDVGKLSPSELLACLGFAGGVLLVVPVMG